MRIAKYFGKTIRLPDDDWKSLMDRLDPRDAVLEYSDVLEENIYTIKKDNPLCKKYQLIFKSIGLGYSCSQCPFTVFRETVGCIDFLELLKPSFRDFITCFYDEVHWSEKNDYKVRNILKDLRKHLLQMEKV